MTAYSKTNPKISIHALTKIAILAALAFVLMMFQFPLPFAPSFYQLDFSEVPVLIGSFALGPMCGVAIECLKIVLHILFVGTTTAYVGDIANFIIGIAFIIPSSLIYRHNKTKMSACIGMLTGTVCMSFIGALLNYAVLIPLYSKLFGISISSILQMGQAIYPFISNMFVFVCVCVVPFNLFKGIIVSVLTLVIYKRVSPLLHQA